jgi:hypothetical protein
MNEDLPPQRHAFNHAPAALRVFRFAVDSAPRVLQLAHVSAFLRECAVEFGSADATLPGALRDECAASSGRFFTLREIVKRKAAHCPWLAAKVLACRSGAPVPAAALAPDVTRHDVNWGAEGARRHADLQLTHDGFGVSCTETASSANVGWSWAQGDLGVTSGKHWFQVAIVALGRGGHVTVGWVDDKISESSRRQISYGDKLFLTNCFRPMARRRLLPQLPLRWRLPPCRFFQTPTSSSSQCCNGLRNGHAK